jgi:hypothetical protein
LARVGGRAAHRDATREENIEEGGAIAGGKKE